MKKIFIFLAIIVFCNNIIRAQNTSEGKVSKCDTVKISINKDTIFVNSPDLSLDWKIPARNGKQNDGTYKRNDTILVISSNLLSDLKIPNAWKVKQDDGTYIRVYRDTVKNVINFLFFTKDFSTKKSQSAKTEKQKDYYKSKKFYEDFEGAKAKDKVILKDGKTTVTFEFNYIEKAEITPSSELNDSELNDSAKIQPLDEKKISLEKEQSKIQRYGIGSVLFLLLLLIILLFILKPSKRTVAKMVRSSVSDTSRQKYGKGDAIFKESQSQLEGLIRRTAELENANADLKYRIETLERMNISLKENQSVSKQIHLEQTKGINPESQRVKEKIMFCDQLNIQKVNESCFKASSDAYCYYKIVIAGNKAKYYINDNEKVQATLAQMATSLYEYTKYKNLTNGKPVSVFETVEPGELEKKDSVWVEKVRIKVIAK